MFSTDSQLALTASDDCTAKIWDFDTGLCLHTLRLRARVVYAAFSPDGLRVVTATIPEPAMIPEPDCNCIKIWCAVTGELVKAFEPHPMGALTAVFSPDGARVLVTTNDGVLKIWAIEPEPRCALRLRHGDDELRAVFSPDGQRILTASAVDGSAKIWSAATGLCLMTLTGHDRPLLSATFSR